MSEWYSGGFFPNELPVKFADDFPFEELGRLVARCGRLPFLLSLEQLRAASAVLPDMNDLRRFPVDGLGPAPVPSVRPSGGLPLWGQATSGFASSGREAYGSGQNAEAWAYVCYAVHSTQLCWSRTGRTDLFASS